MYPRVTSYAALCGANPVASIGQRALAAGKAHESELLDEAIEESFPASDPISPFVPSRTMPTDGTEVESIGSEGAVPAEAPLKDSGDAIDSLE
jgi:hypothetical protein